MIHAEPTEMTRLAQGQGFLSLRGLTRRYDHFTAVDDLNLDVAKGELVAFLGPSGCGKTTSLRMIAGLVPASSGHIVVDGRDLTGVAPYKRDMGLVFQSYALFPHMDIARNVAFGLEMRKVPKAEAAQRVKEAIAMVRLTGREHHRPAQLSGGQQQRVALARALVVRPSILLLDEPLSNLDARLRVQTRQELVKLQRRLGITTIFVTHDQIEALTTCHRVAVMDEGVIQQVGTPMELFDFPVNRFVAQFVGSVNLFAGRFEREGGALRFASEKLGRVALPAGVEPPAGEYDLAFRPHAVSVVDAAGPEALALRGAVENAEFLGEFLRYEIRVAEGLVIADIPHARGRASIAPGTAISLAVPASELRFVAA